MNQGQKCKIAEVIAELENISYQEEQKLDNMESFQETERYKKMEEAKNQLEEAINILNEIITGEP